MISPMLLVFWSLAGPLWLAAKYKESGELVAQNTSYEDFWGRDKSSVCLHDLLIAIFLILMGTLISTNLLAQAGVTETKTANDFAAAAVANAAVSITALLLSWSLIFRRGLKRADPTGVFTTSWTKDVALGIATFLAIGGAVYMLQGLLQGLLAQEFNVKSEHPIIRILKDERTLMTIAATNLSAVIVAPICEEYLFRFLIQGWLESVVAQARAKLEQKEEEPGLETFEYATAKLPETTERRFEPIPIIVPSAVFALMHFQHGAAAITLFFFSLVLGYLFQRTRRLLPSIILHMMLNSISMIQLLAS